jgi:hypothetical protein
MTCIMFGRLEMYRPGGGDYLKDVRIMGECVTYSAVGPSECSIHLLKLIWIIRK